MSCQRVPISTRSHSNPARLEVAHQRASCCCRRSQQGNHPMSGIGRKDGNPPERAEEPASQNAVSFERQERATSHIECLGHDHCPCVPRRSGRCRRRSERLGRKVWTAWRPAGVCRASFERFIARTYERPTVDCSRGVAFPNRDCCPAGPNSIEAFGEERPCWAGQKGAGTPRILWRRAHARPMVLEATGHTRGPCRKGCGNREGGG